MTEDYLHYIWKFQKFKKKGLITTQGEAISVSKQGDHNHNSGPDFSEARMTIGETQWYGSVEIHIHTSDWRKHRHQHDRAYNNVVLHVVYEHDEEVKNQHGDPIPTLELKHLIDHNAYFQYEQFLQKGALRPCANQVDSVPKINVINLLDEMLVNRMMRKSAAIQEMLEDTNNDWEQVFHQLLFKYLGMTVNAAPMLRLAQSVNYKLLQKHAHDLLIAEALLFGQAGMLQHKLEDDYHSRLRSEYLFLKQKFNLTSMAGVEWKFSRMRPANFPTLRIAQIAAIYNNYQHLFQLIRDKVSLRNLQLVFSSEPSDFWKTHYSFKSESKLHKGNLGKVALQNIIINVMAPFAFFYGRSVGDRSYEEYAMLLLESLPGEKNRITKKFEDLEVGILSAKDSQSLIQLDDELCRSKRCLNCKIGVYLLQS